ncbi:hypothetical protein ACIFOT_18845 [Neobacillus sp. NRS-1170]|uniref:hypothetical protein n=1 Tax=Neobacillus sp. NRS-1170 TaxID=3233898 RepID=UPI003D2CBD9F
MDKQNKYPTAMNDKGVPTEMSPIRDISSMESNEPILESESTLKSLDPLEIRTPGSVTVI